MSGAVHKGGLIQLSWYGSKELPQQENIEHAAAKYAYGSHAKPRRKGERDKRVGESRFRPQDKVRDKGGEIGQHNTGHKGVEDNLAPSPLHPGEAVSAQGAGDQNTRHVNQHDEGRVFEKCKKGQTGQRLGKVIPLNGLGENHRGILEDLRHTH